MSFNNDDSRRGFGNDRKRHFGRTARPTFDEAKFNREHPDEPERAPERREFSQERRGGIGSQAHLRRDRDDFANRPSRFDSDRPSFGDRPKRIEGERNFGERREFDKSRANQENFVPAVGDADAAPQVAVGGIKEVEELLNKNPLQVHRVLFMHKSGNPKLYELQKLAKRAHVHVQQVDSKILDSYARPNHGVVALMNEKELLNWMDVREEFFKARDTGEKKLIAVATNIEDPRNLGACIRSSLALGVDILLLPAKGMCGITPSVARTSAGALEKLRICRPDNLEGAIGELKMAGYQILGLDADTETNLAGFDFADHVVLAVGGEDVGLPPFIKKQCDAVLRIPMKPEAHSYNASVALSLGLYEYARLRIKA
ncbi:RNA methyltransferase, TrmH family, group 3 [Fibrobacter succinogenes subsp. succinogenes S85]|uniref:RNA methyltransferase, TrmH family, group 3 n=1 Tax=Fibrobacter succinogenes (strain ATCC 19169 / S85) TaxID=59374 RepID=C9RLF7_FIBSS|nr:RNA methyltransferase [Fibrobacter succinogenes]ACX74104.1 RNA methyltransferase, TrmH family, group 3 [Fibrobacter succinogenes subsp. succinogenes S85]ADL25086.1 RNA methyltransferase, TrmH family, group 3 [Fibrobacter succinogenes subsp. succinogenes S85]